MEYIRTTELSFPKFIKFFKIGILDLEGPFMFFGKSKLFLLLVMGM